MSGVAPILANTLDISNTAVSPLVVQFGDSVEELAAIAELRSNFPQAMVVDFSVYDRILSFKGPIIYVGHSSFSGILYYGKTISWTVLAGMIRNSKSNNHYILGCESSKITELTQSTGKKVFSFEKKVDALIGAYFVSLLIANSRRILPYLFLRLNTLLNNLASPLFLYSQTESGYQIAMKRESLSTQYCILGKCVYTYLENIVWFNLAPWFLNIIKDISLFTTGVYFSNMVNALSTMAGISVALSTTLLMAMIAALIIVINWHAGQRKKGDLKIGMGIQVVPTPMFKAWIDNNEPEKEEDNGRYWFNKSNKYKYASYLFTIVQHPHNVARSILR